jgi:predicted enzyme related to lactoylglutathione lyase
MNPVIHFEMPYENGERLTKFYADIFGWQMQMTGAEMGNYVLAHTAETDEKGMVKTPGAINGGFFKKMAELPTIPSVVIAVTDINAAIKKINDGGGKVLGEPIEIPGVGKYVSFTDTEGNKLSILQPMRM